MPKVHEGLYFPFMLFTSIIFSLRRFFFGTENALNYLKTIDSRSIRLILILHGASIGKRTEIKAGVVFHNCKNFKNLTIGDDCHIGRECFFDLRDRVIIGNKVVISMYTRFVTHIDMSQSSLSILYPADQESILIEDNVYIGIGSTVLKGVRVGHSSLIAADSLLNRSIPPRVMAAGNPALIIKEIR
ncbi:acyltransferase [Pseudidiomarina taiwanensis]|nr:acyltransferase [Pseudidiomarina taiwanensis]